MTRAGRPSPVNAETGMAPAGNRLVTVERASYHATEASPTETILWDLTTRTPQPLGNGYGMGAFSRDGRSLGESQQNCGLDTLSECTDQIVLDVKLVAAPR